MYGVHFMSYINKSKVVIKYWLWWWWEHFDTDYEVNNLSNYAIWNVVLFTAFFKKNRHFFEKWFWYYEIHLTEQQLKNYFASYDILWKSITTLMRCHFKIVTKCIFKKIKIKKKDHIEIFFSFFSPVKHIFISGS